MSTLHEIEKMMDPEFNYQRYRLTEQKLKGAPFVPFIGLYLKDLTFANDGNQTYVAESLLINFSKMWSVYEIICKARMFQGQLYTIVDDVDALKYCSNLTSLSEKRLYSYSLLCEPKQGVARPEANRNLVDSPSMASINENIRLIEKWTEDGNSF
jgi:hypothetical protein